MPDTPDEELVRRLLAGARHGEPMPADVVARLDRVLDGLGLPDEGVEREGVTPLRPAPTTRPRRRWAIGLVAAAAAVTAIALAPRVTITSDGSDSSRASDSSSGMSESAGGSSEGKVAEPQVVELHRATLQDDVRRAAMRLRRPLAEAPPSETFVCARAEWGPGSAHPVRLDGEAAMLVLRPPTKGRQVADVLECGTARPLASVTLPAR